MVEVRLIKRLPRRRRREGNAAGIEDRRSLTLCQYTQIAQEQASDRQVVKLLRTPPMMRLIDKWGVKSGGNAPKKERRKLSTVGGCRTLSDSARKIRAKLHLMGSISCRYAAGGGHRNKTESWGGASP